MRFLRNLFIISLSLLALAGCGGGASDSSGALTLAVSAPPANTDQKGTATATYAPVGGKSPQGVKINFSANSPLIVFDSYQGSVGTDGKATVSFRVLPTPTATPVAITASTGDLTQTQQLNIAETAGAPQITVPSVSATPHSLTFVSASPTKVNLKGFGTSTNPETSIVTFIVKDNAGNALAGQTVDFTLDTSVGGVAVTHPSATSSASGQVATIVSSGTMVTPVKVTATVHGTTITAQSSQLVIAGGPADQDSLSISLSSFNPEARNIDGVEVTITARLADHFNNPVADGTAVYFTTNGGAVEQSCTTTGGVCTVKWKSQNPRPASGVVAVLAFAVGEESFTDLNNDSLADIGACGAPFRQQGIGFVSACGEFIDIPDAFRDDNFNGLRDSDEPFHTVIDGSTTYSGVDELYTGSFVAPSSSDPRSRYIFSNSMIIMSSSAPDAVTLSSSNVPLGTSKQVILTVKDVSGNPMPAETTISASVIPGAASACITVTPSVTTVPNTTDVDEGTLFDVTLVNTCTVKEGGTDSITFTVRTPSGRSTPVTLPISY